MSGKTLVLILACAISVFAFLATGISSHAGRYGDYNYRGYKYKYTPPNYTYRWKRVPRSNPRRYVPKRVPRRGYYRRYKNRY